MIPKSVRSLRIDINSGQVRKSIAICQQDSIMPTINAMLVESGKALDLTDVLWAEIFIHKADGYEADNGCVIDGDSIQYSLHSSDVSAVGINTAQFQLTYKDGSVITTPTFEIVVYQKVLDQRVQQSMNEYTSLSQMVVQANAYKEAAGVSATNAASSATNAENSATNSASSATAAAGSAAEASGYLATVKGYADAAEASATAAESASSSAFGFAEDCESFKDDAAASALAASTSASDAEDYKDAAALSATDAAASATNADDSADDAADSATAAASSATNANDSKVSAKDYMDAAKYYAEKAEEAYRKMGEEFLVLGNTATTAHRGDHGSAAYQHSLTTGNPHNTTYSDVGADQSGAAAAAYQQATGYVDQAIANLINGAPQTLDTLKEIADAIANDHTAVEALQLAIGSKAAEADFQGHAGNTTIHITANERTAWNGMESRIAALEAMIGYPISNS